MLCTHLSREVSLQFTHVIYKNAINLFVFGVNKLVGFGTALENFNIIFYKLIILLMLCSTVEK